MEAIIDEIHRYFWIFSKLTFLGKAILVVVVSLIILWVWDKYRREQGEKKENKEKKQEEFETKMKKFDREKRDKKPDHLL